MSTNLITRTTVDLTKAEREDRRDTIVERLRVGGKFLRTDFAENIVEAEIEYGLETAYQLTLTLFDPNSELIKWNQLKKGLRATLRRSDSAGWDKFALVSVSTAGDNLELVFEDEAVYRCRNDRGFDIVSRDTMTRAEFIYKMVREVTHPALAFVSPQIFVKQPIAVGTDTVKFRDSQNQDQGYGFSSSSTVKVKGNAATDEQLGVIKTVLDLGVQLKVAKTVLVAAIATVTEESSAKNLSGGDRDSIGAFQQRTAWGSADSRHNVKESAQRFYQGKAGVSDGAIKLFAKPDNRDWEPWRLAFEVQHNYDTATKGKESYGRWVTEARKTVDAYLGAGASGYRGSVDRTTKQKYAKYEFTRGDVEQGEAESTWEAARRLADEVQWRLYCYRGTIYYVSDDDLRRRPHKTVLTRRREGVIDLDVSYDVGQPVTQIDASLVADRYHFPPGTLLLVRGLGQVVDEVRWLVSNVRRSLFSQIADVTLVAPVDPLPEPEPEIKSQDVNIDTGEAINSEAGTVRGRIVDIAIQQLSRTGDFTYAQVRPIPATLRGKVTTDCSGFATLCYREAGAPDPNGNGYNGQGSTVTLASYGKAVNKPSPGDLVIYGSLTAGGNGAHVAVVINETEAVGFGSQGGPRRHAINYRGDIVGYRTYPLGD